MKRIEGTALSLQAMKHLEKINKVDVLVGIPSFNNAHTINYVVYQAAKGLESYFPESDSAIFVSDGHSTDGTLATVKALKFPYQVKVILANYVGLPGKGSAVRAIFEAARLLQAKAVALVDSDLRSITPEWINLLLSPALHNTDLVTPFYVRDKYDATITNFLCYPMTVSLYRRAIRQPIGGDFGLSIQLVRELLKSPLWQTPYIHGFGIDIFETHTALAKGFQVRQAFLGTKTHEIKDPSKHLAPMFRQVVGSMFSCVEHYEAAWTRVEKQQKVDTVGETDYSPTPEPITIKVHSLVDTYRSNFLSNKKVYRAVLPNSLLEEFKKLKKQKADDFFISSEIWAKSVYSFAAHFKDLELPKREELLEAFRILWIGRVASYINETRYLTTSEAGSKIEEEAETFLKLRSFLVNAFCEDAG
jgi:glycosyltransferase involved in cell wall biosynthesis